MNENLDFIGRKLREALPELATKFGVRRLWVCGSRARGDHRPDSDLDLLVEFGDKKPSLFEFAGLELHLQDLLNLKVEIGERGALRPEIAAQVNKEAIEV
jgi:predicted nucleotidyltransferase